MKQKIHILISFVFLTIASVNAQNPDPHGTPASVITGMPSEKIVMVLEITVNDSLQYQQYWRRVEPLIEKFGGIYLVRSGGMTFDPDPNRKVIPLEGDWNPNRFIIIQWDSMEALQKFSISEEYLTAAKFRENSASTKSIIVKQYH